MKIVINSTQLCCPNCQEDLGIDDDFEMDVSEAAIIHCTNPDCNWPIYIEVLISFKDLILLRGNQEELLKITQEQKEIDAIYTEDEPNSGIV